MTQSDEGEAHVETQHRLNLKTQGEIPSLTSKILSHLQISAEAYNVEYPTLLPSSTPVYITFWFTG